MAVYPRSRTWPYAVIALGLFALTVSFPQWPDDWRQIPRRLSNVTRLRAVSTIRPSNRQPALAEHPLPAPVVAALEPPVAQRIAVDVDPEFAEYFERVSAAMFPREVVDPAEAPALVAVRRDVDDAIGPVLPPGVESIDAVARPLELARPDLDPLVTPPQEPDLSAPHESDRLDDVISEWPNPQALAAMLNSLSVDNAQIASWVADVRKRLVRLTELTTLSDEGAQTLLAELRWLASRTSMLEPFASPQDQIRLRQLRYGISRRCDIWSTAGRLQGEQQAAPLLVNVIDALPVIEAVNRRIADHPHAEEWRAWLTLDRLAQIATETWVSDPTVRRNAARLVLLRLQSDELTSGQLQFLQDPAIRDLQRHLADWADQPVDLRTLLQTLEQFEQLQSSELAEQIVDQLIHLEFCRRPAAAELATLVDTHYRNANVRVSVSGELLNDLMPVLEPIQQQIRDTILGAAVVGQNRTWTDLNLHLIDDPNRLRIRIQAEGQTRSSTVSRKGPVRFFSTDQSQFQAGKDLLVSADGVFVTHATATAEGRSRLLDVQTDYDDIPLLGWILKQIALDEHREQRFRLRRELKQRVSRRVSKQFDQSVQERLEGTEDKIDRTILSPLRELKLDPRAVEMRTQDEELVMRFRLAAAGQLAAYTPRPRADESSILSLQLHESAANNLMQQLKLEDRRIELEELMTCLSEKLHVQRQDIHEELPEGVTIRLAKQRPIHFEFRDDRVVVEFRLQELATPGNTWKNFAVRARYKADMGQTHLDLERDGGIELISEQLGFRDRVVLRGIFTKVMMRNHRLNVLHGRVKNNAHLKNLGITQFVARDGWIGVSVGPIPEERVANRQP